jgi:hypothetical protein
MSLLVVVLTLALLAAVIAVVSRPLLGARTQTGTDKQPEPRTPERAELEAAREAKYREIRDAELDYRTGKLSLEDYEAVNGALRAEAVAILDRLETVGKQAGHEAGERPAEQDERAPEQDASEQHKQEEPVPEPPK